MAAIINVVTVCYNEIDGIARCVDSVLGQSYRDLHYIVIDGASTDGTAEWLAARRAALHHFVSAPDGGIYAAMNAALAACDGEVVYFLNADDHFFDRDTVARAMAHFAADASLDLLAGRVQFFNTPLRDGRPYQRHDFSFRTRLDLFRNPIPQQCLFARRRLFARIGGFDERYRMCADFDWLIRALGHGVKVRHTTETFCHFDYQGVSFTQNARRKREKNLIALRSFSAGEMTRYVAAGLRARLGRSTHGRS